MKISREHIIIHKKNIKTKKYEKKIKANQGTLWISIYQEKDDDFFFCDMFH